MILDDDHHGIFSLSESDAILTETAGTHRFLIFLCWTQSIQCFFFFNIQKIIYSLQNSCKIIRVGGSRGRVSLKYRYTILSFKKVIVAMFRPVFYLLFFKLQDRRRDSKAKSWLSACWWRSRIWRWRIQQGCSVCVCVCLERERERIDSEGTR